MSGNQTDAVPHDTPWSPEHVRQTIDVIAGKWALAILHALRTGPLRRSDLRARVGGISDKMLTETLRRMETQDLVSRSAIASVPVEVDYALTPVAFSLWPVLGEMHAWAQNNLA
jgi:DNA-binding HxlR family transcriptional regulator